MYNTIFLPKSADVPNKITIQTRHITVKMLQEGNINPATIIKLITG